MKIIFRKNGLVEVTMDPLTWLAFARWINEGLKHQSVKSASFKYVAELVEHLSNAVTLKENGILVIKSQAHISAAVELARQLMEDWK